MKKIFNVYNIALILVVALVGVLTFKTTEVKAAGTVSWPDGSTATISRTVQNVYNAPEVEFTYKIVTAVLDLGGIVCKKMKQLVTNSATAASVDTSIQAIKRGNALPSGFTPTTENTISDATSDYPVYIWFEAQTGTIYFYSESDKIYLNSRLGGTNLCYKMEALTDISGLAELDVSTTDRMVSMFQGCRNLTNIDALVGWDVSNVQVFNRMFADCTSLTNMNGARNWNLSSATTMTGLFSGCTSLTNINGLAGWDASGINTIHTMFQNCTALTNVDALAAWNTSSLTNMGAMFDGCTSLTNINGLSNWDVSSLEILNATFQNCTNLSNINGMRNWNTSSVTNIAGLFYHDSKASGTIQILNNPTTASSAFDSAATESGTQITVNYSSNVTLIDNIIATKSGNSNVVKGSVVSIPQSSGSSSGSGSSPTTVNEATISFNGTETVSNSYTVTKSTTLNLATAGLKFRSPGDYEVTIKETATSNSAYPVDKDNEYKVIIIVTNVTDQNGTPTGNFNARFIVKDDNDTKVSNMPFNEPKDETKFGHIELTKTVKGIMADRTKDFSFSVQVDDAASSACQSYSGSEKYLIKGTGVPEDGSEVTKCKSGTKDSITLNHGETATIGQFNYNGNTYDSISIDDYYKIIEGTESDYTTTFKINSGSESSGNDTGSNSITHSGNAVTFYNQKEGSPLTGLFLTILPYLILVGIGVGGVLLFQNRENILKEKKN